MIYAKYFEEGFMTLPDERYRAIKTAEQFLIRLAGGQIARVPKAVRDEARSILRHYPSNWDLSRLSQAAPDVIQERMEPLHRMIAAYEELTPERNQENSST